MESSSYTVPKKNDAKLVLVGRITKAHGVKGELALNLFADSPEILEGEIFLKKSPTAEAVPVRIEKMRAHHGGLLLTFAHIKDRNEADLLRGCEVLVPRKKLPPLSEEEAYLTDMLGLKVIVQEEGKTFVLGNIENIDAPAGQELWSIRTPDGLEVLLPAVPEFVLSIDLEVEEVVIAPPQGLLDIYLSSK